jgi:hypothetical protein
MTRRDLVFLCVGFIGAGLIFTCLSAAPQAAPATGEKSAAQFAQERFDVATRGYDAALESSRRGLGDGTTIWLRRRMLAAMDLPDPAVRVKAMHECVTQLKENFEKRQRGMKMGVISFDEVLSAQYQELEGELWLAKMQEKH